MFLIIDGDALYQFHQNAAVQTCQVLVGLEIFNIGNNLNQIAAFFNSGGIQSRAILEEINRCMTDLRAMRKEIAGLAGDYRGNLKTRRG